jgi:biotin transport system substrate-specific component
MLWIAGFAAATALAARVEIPNNPVPYTLQTICVLLAGAFLGARNGAMSQLVYLAAGALGAPVFALGGFGVATLLGPTGGYLFAFPIAAAMVGYLVARHKSFPAITLAMAAALFVIFTSGTLFLNALYIHNIRAAFSSGFLIFSWWDVIKLFAASTIYYELAKRWPKVG